MFVTLPAMKVAIWLARFTSSSTYRDDQRARHARNDPGRLVSVWFDMHSIASSSCDVVSLSASLSTASQRPGVLWQAHVRPCPHYGGGGGGGLDVRRRLETRLQR